MKHVENYFEGREKLKLYYQSWLPEVEVKGVLLIAHGVAEHCGRYTETAEYFVNKGYAVYGFDYRGHSKSKGRRGYVEHFFYYLDDLKIFLRLMNNHHPQQKPVLFGHSMGAIIGLAVGIYSQKEFSGLILSGTAFKVKPDLPPAVLALLKPLALFMPGLGLHKIDSSTLSRDERVVASYNNDPLVYRGKLSARLAIELVWLIHQLKGQISQIKIPVLILHGAEDRLSYPEGAKLVFERVSSPDKALKMYPGFYHEILNEPGHLQVLVDMERWLTEHSFSSEE